MKHLYGKLFLFIISGTISYFSGVALYRFIQGDDKVLGTSTYITELDKENFISVPLPPFHNFYELAPNRSWVDHPEWLDSEVRYTINADGLNETKDYDIAKKPEGFRIMTVGDSFTFGQFVTTASNYSEKLETMLQTSSCGQQVPFEVINLGVPGYDVIYTVAHFQNKGVKYNPDLIIWILNTHNVGIRDYEIDEITKLTQDLSKEEIASLTKNDHWFLWRSASDNIWQKHGKTELLRMVSEYLGLLNELYDGKVLLVINDDYKDELSNSFLSTFIVSNPHMIVQEKFPDLGAIDGNHPDGHPNTKGHIKLATDIYNHLRRSQLLPCQY